MLKTIIGRSTLIFVLLIFAVGVMFFCALSLTQKAIKNEELNRQYLVILSINKLYEKKLYQEIGGYLAVSEFSQITDDKEILEIISKGDKFYNSDKYDNLSGYYYDGGFYLLVKNTKNLTYKLYKSNHASNKYDVFLITGFIVLLLILFYFYYHIYKTLKPLEMLAIHIKKWSKREIKNDFIYDKSDEIGLLTKEFNKASSRIDELILSRQFFLRAIMHELKTPIGKGMIITDLPYNQKNNDILKQVFERLSVLVNEFGKIEQVLSKNHILNLQEYNFSILFEQVKDIMFLENEDVIKVEYLSDDNIIVDIDLFTLLLKNLLDNALKYSIDNKCYLSFYKNEIIVKNKGSKLEYNITEYFKPFMRGNSEKPGLGLGLYLIKYICDIHNFSINYSYSGDFHIFRVKL